MLCTFLLASHGAGRQVIILVLGRLLVCLDQLVISVGERGPQRVLTRLVKGGAQGARWPIYCDLAAIKLRTYRLCEESTDPRCIIDIGGEQVLYFWRRLW